MKKFILPALLGLAIVTGCKKNEKETVGHAPPMQTEHTSTEMAPTQDEHMEGMANMELDNGKKWKTNTEMLPFIQQQEKLLEAYDSDKGDYKKLAAYLNSANEKLIKSCTMTGRSHDVLHVWLTEHMRKIDRLSKTTNREEAEKLTEDLRHSMETYHHYFE